MLSKPFFYIFLKTPLSQEEEDDAVLIKHAKGIKIIVQDSFDDTCTKLVLS